jgi:hypothetical protein
LLVKIQTLLWLRNGVMVVLVVSDWASLTMIYGLVLLLVGAAAIERREVDQRRLRHGGTGHGGEEAATFGDGS